MAAGWGEFPPDELYACQPPRPPGQDAPTTQLVHWEQGAVTRPWPAIEYAAHMAKVQARGERILRIGGAGLGALFAGLVGQVAGQLVIAWLITLALYGNPAVPTYRHIPPDIPAAFYIWL